MSDAKRAVLFANGIIEDHSWIKSCLAENDYLIAVDGGYRHMQKAGVKPDLLVGDLDSLDERDIRELQSCGVEILKLQPEKDETDLEIALLTALRQGCTILRVIGAFGGRMDHWLANLFTLCSPVFAGCDIRFIDQGVTAFLIRDQSEIHGHPDDIISLLPLSSVVHGVKTEGLKYPLRSEILYAHQSRGVSNEMLSQQARVSIHSGQLLCLHLEKSEGKI